MNLDVLELIVHDYFDFCWSTDVFAEKDWIVLESLCFDLSYNVTTFGNVLFQLAARLGLYLVCEHRRFTVNTYMLIQIEHW